MLPLMELLHVRVVRAARLLEQRDGRHDLARRAVAALIRVASYERRLHGMQRVGRAEALDGGDRLAVVHHREAQTGIDPPAVHVHGARAALSVVAALFRAGEGDGLAQAVEQRRAWVHAKPVLLAVDAKHERHGAAAISCSRRIGSPALPRDIGRIHRADDSNGPCADEEGSAADSRRTDTHCSRLPGLPLRHSYPR